VRGRHTSHCKGNKNVAATTQTKEARRSRADAAIAAVKKRKNLKKKMKEFLLYAHSHRSILGVAGHIILTPANQLMVMGLKIWSLSNSGFEPLTFQPLAQRANQMSHVLPWYKDTATEQ
jgi:hypothetical protein